MSVFHPSQAPAHGKTPHSPADDSYHPTQGSAVFNTVPQRQQHDTSPLLVGRGLDTHLQLHLPCLSCQHLSLEPYWEKRSALLVFNLKALSPRGCMRVKGLALRFLEQVPLSTTNRVVSVGIQMVVHVEGGTSLEAFCLLLPHQPHTADLQAPG